MPENRFPWRDIYSVAAWKKILEITHTSANQDLSNRTEKLFDTSDAKIVKDEVSAHGQYAFAWSTENQIYSAPHKAGTLHHSSFTQGYKVKAAGMGPRN